jgi:DNA replication protein DnaC
MDAAGLERLTQDLKRLKLRRVREELEDYNRLAISQQLSHLDFLGGLLHEEVTARDTTQQHKRLAAAGFPVLKTLEGFDFTFQTSISRAEVMDLARLRFVDERSNVCLVGPPGVGKSHLATALGYKAVLAGRSVRFTTAQDLVEDLYAALADGSLRTRMRILGRLDLLIIDELGFLSLDNTASNHFFQVVAQAYEQRSLIVTSNRPYQEWGNIFASSTIATAVLDRLLHHVTTLNLRGDSYRLKGGMPQPAAAASAVS